MKYLLAGGGTAGHINPAIAIATVITEKEPDAQILFVGNEGGMEQKLVAQAGFDFKTIKISGFSRKLTPKAFAHNIKTAARALTATIAAGKIIKEFAPDYCIGTGGYVSGPVIKAAIKAGIKTAVHEQNAFPGVTTKMLSKNAGVVMLAQEGAKAYLNKKSNCVLTGNPLKKEIITAKKPES
ncbi:MAG: glycosyltransferase, partial [Oscillospiraceae bacterium]|nr:glycosyltransferase [Oscillospiraceae bacterium]